MELVEMLEKIGVPRQEGAVYLALVKSGGMGASDVAASTGLHRPNVYDILKRLEEKGLAGSSNLNGKTFYKGRSIGGIRDYMQEKLDCLGELEKQLKRYETEEKECEVVVYGGKRAIRAHFADYVETMKRLGGDSLLVGVDERKFMEADRLAVERLFEALKREGLKERVLVCEGETYLPAPKQTTTYAALPKKYFDSATSFQVFGDKVAIVIFSEPVHVITIKSRRTANAYRKKFELLWKNAKVIRR